MMPVPDIDRTLLKSNCWAEINLDALDKNVQILKSLDSVLMAVLKSDSYGHSTSIIAPELLRLGINHFGVATSAEGAELRLMPGFSQAKIYIMTATVSEDAETICNFDLIPFVSSSEALQSIQRCAFKLNKIVQIHLEIDTGIGRAGILPDQFLQFFESSSKLRNIQISGVCTHFSTGEDADDAHGQIEIFESCLRKLPVEILSSISIHAANSPGVINSPNAHYGMIRPGLLLYGIAPCTSCDRDPWRNFPFEPVLSLFSRVILIRDLPAGSDISYGRTYHLDHPARIATIGIGYGDGYPRRLSNSGQVLLPSGNLAPIRGRVCMDQLCIELPATESLKAGDIVSLVGKSKFGDSNANDPKSLDAVNLAESIGATPHEITTGLTGRVPRIPVRHPI